DVLYTFSIAYRTNSVPELDYFRIRNDAGDFSLLEKTGGDLLELTTDGNWNRIVTTFTLNEDVEGRLMVGTDFSSNDTTFDLIDIKKPYLTSSTNEEWIFHPADKTQSIESITRRVTNLEDGRKELITRTEWDSQNDFVSQTIREIEESVEV